MLEKNEIKTNKIYINVNESNVVTRVFSDAFENPTEKDIFLEEGIGSDYIHVSNRYTVVDSDMRYNYCFHEGKLIKRTEEEKKEDLIELLRNEKIQEIGENCKNIIYAGMDVETSLGKKHFSLTLEDQTNLSYAFESVKSGLTEFPYHADGEICSMYSKEDIEAISTAATRFKLYHTTYCNHLNALIRRATTVDEVKDIQYGMVLPKDLLESFDSIIGGI